jgi:hypothetical protein
MVAESWGREGKADTKQSNPAQRRLITCRKLSYGYTPTAIVSAIIGHPQLIGSDDEPELSILGRSPV